VKVSQRSFFASGATSSRNRLSWYVGLTISAVTSPAKKRGFHIQHEGSLDDRGGLVIHVKSPIRAWFLKQVTPRLDEAKVLGWRGEARANR